MRKTVQKPRGNSNKHTKVNVFGEHLLAAHVGITKFIES